MALVWSILYQATNLEHLELAFDSNFNEKAHVANPRWKGEYSNYELYLYMNVYVNINQYIHALKSLSLSHIPLDKSLSTLFQTTLKSIVFRYCTNWQGLRDQLAKDFGFFWWLADPRLALTSVHVVADDSELSFIQHIICGIRPGLETLILCVRHREPSLAELRRPGPLFCDRQQYAVPLHNFSRHSATLRHLALHDVEHGPSGRMLGEEPGWPATIPILQLCNHLTDLSIGVSVKGTSISMPFNRPRELELLRDSDIKVLYLVPTGWQMRETLRTTASLQDRAMIESETENSVKDFLSRVFDMRQSCPKLEYIIVGLAGRNGESAYSVQWLRNKLTLLSVRWIPVVLPFSVPLVRNYLAELDLLRLYDATFIDTGFPNIILPAFRCEE
ncbi:hypothetical protein TWF696_001437 [Orbilia brochopaga]|uniref:Uncharacterized protein n=1 Tax=Orbilia brochopaga TaxID=3140254 RepID=A0AAV9UC73_9PEZI